MDKQLSKTQFRQKKANQAFPNRKVEQELMMFKEIFIKPKEIEIEKAKKNEQNLLSQEFLNRVNRQKKVAEDKNEAEIKPKE